MEQDLFENLPSEIITNILSRVTVRTIAICKCVCKSWLDLVENDEFVKFHLSRSAAALAVLRWEEGNSRRCTVFDLEGEIDVEGSTHGVICVGKNEVNANALYLCNPLTNFNFPHSIAIEGSANGLLFPHKYDGNGNADALYVCNPISREYIELHCPQEIFIPNGAIYGFGASKITGQHKVVGIKCNYEHKVVGIERNYDCHVYTLGTGSWTRVEAPRSSFSYQSTPAGAFVDGNLHWLVVDSNGDKFSISCFDLETERFSTFGLPITNCKCYEGFSVLRDCLCYCDATSQKGQNVIWLMKEYGDEKSWTKEYLINLNCDVARDEYICVYPIKVFKDGESLMVRMEGFLSYYSNKTKTTQKIGVFNGGINYINSMLLTPSLLSLKSFPMKNVIPL